MKLPYLGIYNPLLAYFNNRLSGNGNGRHGSSRPAIAGSRFQLAKPMPRSLKGDTWQLCPLQIDNATIAYEAYLTNPQAVVQHNPHAHLVEPYTWQAHQQRVERSVQAHQTHAGFTFILLDTDASKCLGCVHILPLRPFLHYNNAPAHLIIRAGDNAAMITYWLTSAYMHSDFHALFIAKLHHWLTHDWGLIDHFFRLTPCQNEAIAIMEQAGLKAHFCLLVPPHQYTFYGD